MFAHILFNLTVSVSKKWLESNHLAAFFTDNKKACGWKFAIVDASAWNWINSVMCEYSTATASWKYVSIL